MIYAAGTARVPRGRLEATARAALIALLLLASAACGADAADEEGAAAEDPAEWLDFPAPPTRPYEVVDVMSGGAITGEVVLHGDPPEGTLVRVTIDPAVCGTDYVEQPVVQRDGRVADVVVWLHDIRRGRRLPVERLFAVGNLGCQVVPRVQGMFTGGTVNVRSADPVAHRLRFTRLHDAEILSVVRHNDAGQVVPVQNLLSRPGLIRTDCEMHPWTVGWIAVFDHPYYAVTGLDGRFAIDAIPPGRYRLVAWHESLGRIEREVEVPAAGELVVEMGFGP